MEINFSPTSPRGEWRILIGRSIGLKFQGLQRAFEFPYLGLAIERENRHGRRVEAMADAAASTSNVATKDRISSRLRVFVPKIDFRKPFDLDEKTMLTLHNRNYIFLHCL